MPFRPKIKAKQYDIRQNDKKRMPKIDLSPFSQEPKIYHPVGIHNSMAQYKQLL